MPLNLEDKKALVAEVSAKSQAKPLSGGARPNTVASRFPR